MDGVRSESQSFPRKWSPIRYSFESKQKEGHFRKWVHHVHRPRGKTEQDQQGARDLQCDYSVGGCGRRWCSGLGAVTTVL